MEHETFLTKIGQAAHTNYTFSRFQEDLFDAAAEVRSKRKVF
jgi:hypothetical protein